MQTALFYDDEFQALEMMVGNGKKTTKQLAQHLFPHMKLESAYARLKNCMNPNGDQRLSFGQIIAAMKFCDAYDPLYCACDETLHSRPERKAPQDERMRLIQVISTAAATMDRAMKQIESIKATS